MESVRPRMPLIATHSTRSTPPNPPRQRPLPQWNSPRRRKQREGCSSSSNVGGGLTTCHPELHVRFESCSGYLFCHSAPLRSMPYPSALHPHHYDMSARRATGKPRHAFVATSNVAHHPFSHSRCPPSPLKPSPLCSTRQPRTHHRGWSGTRAANEVRGDFSRVDVSLTHLTHLTQPRTPPRRRSPTHPAHHANRSRVRAAHLQSWHRLASHRPLVHSTLLRRTAHHVHLSVNCAV